MQNQYPAPDIAWTEQQSCSPQRGGEKQKVCVSEWGENLWYTGAHPTSDLIHLPVTKMFSVLGTTDTGSQHLLLCRKWLCKVISNATET